MSDPGGVSNKAAFAYAASKLDAAAVLSASHLQDMYQPYNLGFISAAYTAAHETMELLLKVYLKKGPWAIPRKEAWGHDLGELFMKWDAQGRTKAELAYQDGVLGDLKANRIGKAAGQATLNLGRHRELPPDYSERKAEYNEAFHQYQVKLLHEGSPTVRDVVDKLDAALGPKNITRLCKPTHAEMIKGYPCNPEVWYPKELLSTEWVRFDQATRQGESLGFVEAFLKREGTKLVFEGWRYLDEMKLEKAGIVFHGPPAKMILMAQQLEGVVLAGI